MGKPIAVLGATSEEFTNKVISLRKQIHAKGYDSASDQLYTVPHLTLAFNKSFNLEEIEEVKRVILHNLNNEKRFTITVNEFIIMDKNITASFENRQTREFAHRISKELDSIGFEIVETDHMRLIRSEVKDEFLEEVRMMTDKTLPKQIEIIGIAIAGKLLRKEDMLWTTSLI